MLPGFNGNRNLERVMAKKFRNRGDLKKNSSKKVSAPQKDGSLRSRLNQLRKTASSAYAEARSVRKESAGIRKAAKAAEQKAHALHLKVGTTEAHVADAEKQIE